MPTTSPDGFVYPDVTGPVQVPQDIQALANSVQTMATAHDTRLDALEGAGSSSVVFKYKTAGQSVTSSTTLIDDTHLVGMSLGVGTWLIQEFYKYSGDITGSGAPNLQFAFTGTTSSSVRNGIGIGASATSGVAENGGVTGGTLTSAHVLPKSHSSVGSLTAFCETVAVVTVTGTLKLQWAQDVSSATSATLSAGSYVRCEKVA